MSTLLWKYFFENDVQKFRQVLENAVHNPSAGSSKNSVVGRGGITGTTPSPGTSLSASPTLSKGKRVHGAQTRGNPTSSRIDVNWQDQHGVTLLHYIATSPKETAFGFAQALIQVPFLDLYIQDAESGWTALHRALYFGNVSIARALLNRDINDAIGHGHLGTHQGAGGLIKVKDHEGKSPFDVYAATITRRVIHQGPSMYTLSGSSDSEDDDLAHGVSGDNDNDDSGSKHIAPNIVVNGDQVFAFGSNKNFTLGFGDEDDRQYPERVTLTRPDHLLKRLNADHESLISASAWAPSASPTSTKPSPLPALVQYRPIIIQDVQLSKLHSSILTTDPEANLYMCGFGSGGRLGTGDETTRFHYVPVFGGGLMGKKVNQVGLGQNHTIAISSHGEAFTWGINAFGQLGYASATPRFPNEEPVQLLPRQIFGSLKREVVIGAAASRIHSVVYTPNSLFTFGKNEGQLGLVDSDARSLIVQGTPRKVAAALFASPITAVSAIDTATVCLLENHDVWVFANYGYTKMAFPLESFSNYFLRSSYAATRYSSTPNEICKITAGGDTICALSSMGDVFTTHVTQNVETAAASTSTTNPSKIRGALSAVQRVWSMNRGQMAVTDVDVGQDGSVIICTDSGSVWRRVKRAKIKDTQYSGCMAYKSKDYKFSRVPGLTKITAVRSNAFGAYAAIRKDSDVLQSQIGVDSPALWKDIFPLLPLRSLGIAEDPDSDQPALRFWVSSPPTNDTSCIRRGVLAADNLEHQLPPILSNLELSDSLGYDLRIGSTASEVVFPVHEFVLAGRSEIMRRALMDFRQNYFLSVADVMTIEYDSEGKVLVNFKGADLLTVLNVVLYIYTDSLVDVWHQTRHAPKLASKYRQVRLEIMKIAAGLEMKSLEQAVRLMVEPSKTLHNDLGHAIRHPDFFNTGDVELKLDGQSLMVHSAMICHRCPFFEGLFHGRAGGAWLSSRQGHEAQERIEVDLTHIDPAIFQLVLQHIYADAGEAIFNHVVTADFDAFLDLIMEVMSVANELMLDRLAQCCQLILGRYVNMRNVCQLLNAVARCSVTEFKNAALEYICLNLEGMLENHLLDELDEDLMLELDEVVRQNQLACLPFAKSGRAEAELIDRHPGLRDTIERGRRAKIDSLALRSRLRDEDAFYANAAKARPAPRNDDDTPSSLQKMKPRSSSEKDVRLDNPLKQKASNGDLMFEMEEDDNQSLAQGHERASAFEDTPLAVPRTPASNLPLAGSSSSMKAITPEQQSILGDSINPPHDSPTQVSEYALSPNNIGMTAGVWKSSAFESSKLTMKEIMDQASLSSRTSNLSSGLALKARNTDNIPSGSAAKLSQRERKRQQQQAQLQQQDSSASPEAIAQSEDAANPTSPWQVAGQGSKVSLKDVLAVEATKSPSSPLQQKAGRQASAPPLTLRQTVPGKAPAPQGSAGGRSQQQEQQGTTPKRSVSTPSAIKKPSAAPLEAPLEGSSTPSPNIRSIRHGPPPVEPSLQLSMADILAQQQIEKDVIKEAVAKRSLQEIQEEQAFQEWWDQESKKVQEEEAARGKTVNQRGGRGRGGRGRSRNSRGRGRGRGALLSTENATEQAQSQRSRETLSEERGSKSTGRRDARRDHSEGGRIQR
ncbi:MAG: hypothetical protein Q9191_004433 [Dirinaria sp. TL-2023a]